MSSSPPFHRARLAGLGRVVTTTWLPGQHRCRAAACPRMTLSSLTPGSSIAYRYGYAPGTQPWLPQKPFSALRYGHQVLGRNGEMPAVHLCGVARLLEIGIAIAPNRRGLPTASAIRAALSLNQSP